MKLQGAGEIEELEPIELEVEEVDAVASRLRAEGVARLPREGLTVRLERPHGDLDLVISSPSTEIGFITLSRFPDGFRIVGDPYAHDHPGFDNEIDVGIEVKPGFRRRGFGNLLVQLATRLAQLEHAEKPLAGGFRVYARGVRYPEQKRRLGFEVEGSALRGWTAEYLDPEAIPHRQRTPLELALRRLETTLRGLLKEVAPPAG